MIRRYNYVNNRWTEPKESFSILDDYANDNNTIAICYSEDVAKRIVRGLNLIDALLQVNKE